MPPEQHQLKVCITNCHHYCTTKCTISQSDRAKYFNDSIKIVSAINEKKEEAGILKVSTSFKLQQFKNVAVYAS